jgi:hypothetical protein
LFFAGGGAALAFVLFFAIPARSRAWRALFSLLAVGFLLSAVGCGSSEVNSRSGGGGSGGGGSASRGTTPGPYNLIVTAADAATGKITATTTVSLTVN